LGYSRIAERVLIEARNAGAEQGEVYCVRNKTLEIEVSGREVETMEVSEEEGVGLRVIRDGRMGFAYSSKLTDMSLRDLAHQAVENSKYNEVDQYHNFPKPQPSNLQWDIYDPEILRASIEGKIRIAKKVEETALQQDKRIKKSEKVAYHDSVYNITIINTNGVNVEYQGAYCGCYGIMVAEENGDVQTGMGLDYKLKFRDLDPEQIGREASKRALQMLGAKSVETQKVPVIFDPTIATDFLGILAPALNADSVQKGKSFLKGKIGQKIASAAITIVDDGTLTGGIAAKPYDGEGVPTSRTILIEDGILKNYLYNSYTAAKDGVQSTGNGIRGSYAGTPEVGTTNFFIQPGKETPENLIADIKSGFYVTEVMGMHTANPVSGDFSVGAAGIWIENGKLTKPIRGVAIAGNVLELLNGIEAVGNDLRFFGGTGSPTIRIKGITVSGS
jgi:PmbA protein